MSRHRDPHVGWADDTYLGTPSAGPFPPLTVPCPLEHANTYENPRRVSAELPDGSKVTAICGVCGGRGKLFTDFGYAVLKLVGEAHARWHRGPEGPVAG